MVKAKATERFLPSVRGNLVSPNVSQVSTKYMPPRIAFVGPRRVGKDTAGTVFKKHGYEHASFIRPVKNMLAEFLKYQGVRWDVVGKMIEGDLKEKPAYDLGGVTPRFWMQRMGIFMRATFGDGIFIHALGRSIAAHDPYGEVPFFLTDCRFPNEAEALVSNGWVIVRIERPGLPQDETDKYVTETAHEAIKADHTLVNNFATAEEFSEYVEKWAKEQGLIRS
jgi:hypothetical protein